MVDAILTEIYNLTPKLDIGDRRGSTDYIDFIRVEELTSPVMSGVDCMNRKFIVFKTENKFQTFFQRYTDGVLWMGAGNGRPIMDTAGGINYDQAVFLRALYMIGRVDVGFDLVDRCRLHHNIGSIIV
jgi:hypothetical protein